MEFATDELTLDEYIQLVVDEDRDVKEEIVKCVRLMVEYPGVDAITMKLLAQAIYALLELL